MSRRICLLLVMLLSLWGCAAKKEAQEPTPLVPMPPLENVAATPPKPVSVAPAQEEGQTLTVYRPADTASGPRRGEPEELAALLEMKGEPVNVTAVNLMRPNAIREAAQTVTFQAAMAYRYKQLVAATERHSAALDAAFNFSLAMVRNVRQNMRYSGLRFLLADTPKRSAVAGISCIRPTAPLGETAWASKPDSTAITALIRS